MNDELVRKVGSRGIDNLIAHVLPPAIAHPIMVKGTGTVVRGTLLGTKAEDDSELYEIVTKDGKVEPSCILCDDVEATAEGVAAAAYFSGTFNINAIVTGEGYELKHKDKDRLRTYNIFLVPQRD